MAPELHTPVMAEEAVRLLLSKDRGLFVDATVGTGGHAERLLRGSTDGVRLFGIDRDPRAIEEARARLAPFGSRVEFASGNFRRISEILGDRTCDGILLDLGVSTLQLSDAARGFSYLADGPLDMTMGPDGRSVRTLLSTAKTPEIAAILRAYGEERRSNAIAREIVRRRDAGAMATTFHLRDAVAAVALPHRTFESLSRVFQALRIWANEELESLDEFLPQAVERLATGGRIVIISYHSLEDRKVKHFFRREERGCVCPPDIPECRCGRAPRLSVLTRRPLRPSAEEIESNPRSRSAKLRAAERI
jgi:16S rRNA (cytosine1402-N4)-methyltransferase